VYSSELVRASFIYFLLFGDYLLFFGFLFISPLFFSIWDSKRGHRFLAAFLGYELFVSVLDFSPFFLIM